MKEIDYREGDRVMLTRNVFALPPRHSLGIAISVGYHRTTVKWPSGKVNVVPAHWLRRQSALELLAMQAEGDEG